MGEMACFVTLSTSVAQLVITKVSIYLVLSMIETSFKNWHDQEKILVALIAGTEIGVVAGRVRQEVGLHTLIIVVNCLVGPQGGLNGQKVDYVIIWRWSHGQV